MWHTLKVNYYEQINRKVGDKMTLTNIGLVEHCKKALGEKWGYVYGTYGTTLTEKLLANKQVQYPQNIVQYLSFIRKNWIGKCVTDCVGLIKSYIWWVGTGPVYNPKTDLSANGMFNAATVKGDISTIPEIPGLCVRKNGHIGVYVSNGQVIESKGTKYGVVQTPLHGIGATKWTHWLKCPFIEYIEPVDELKESLEFICNKADLSFEHWYKQAKEIKYLDIAFKKIAKAWRGLE
jgi:hypothetical protein